MAPAKTKVKPPKLQFAVVRKDPREWRNKVKADLRGATKAQRAQKLNKKAEECGRALWGEGWIHVTVDELESKQRLRNLVFEFFGGMENPRTHEYEGGAIDGYTEEWKNKSVRKKIMQAISSKRLSFYKSVPGKLILHALPAGRQILLA